MTTKQARKLHRLLRGISLFGLGYAVGRAHQSIVDTAKFAAYGKALKLGADTVAAALRHRSERDDHELPQRP